jgi:hypothetical protein
LFIAGAATPPVAVFGEALEVELGDTMVVFWYGFSCSFRERVMTLLEFLVRTILKVG